MTETVTVRMTRSDGNTPWGFRLEGGQEFSAPIAIGQVTTGSLADRAGLKEGDKVSELVNRNCQNLRHKDAQEVILTAGNNLELIVQRRASGSAGIWKPPVDSGVTVSKFQHSVHSTGASSTEQRSPPQQARSPPQRARSPPQQARSPPQQAPAPPAVSTPVKVSLEHHPKELNVPGHNMSARPYSMSQEEQRSPGSYQHTHQTQVAHMQYNSPAGLYSNNNVADAYLQQTGGLFGTDPGLSGKYAPGQEPAYLSSGTLALIKEEEGEHHQRTRARSPMPPSQIQPTFAEGRSETLHHTRAAEQSDSFKRLTTALGGLPEPSKRFVSSQVFNLERREMQEPPHHRSPVPPASVEGAPNCETCGRHILGAFCKAEGKSFHGDCFKCTTCGTALKNIGYFQINGKFYCDIHAEQQKINLFQATAPKDPSTFLPRAPPPPAPTRSTEPPRGFYQPEILKPGPVSPLHPHVSPLSPASRGVPHHHSYASPAAALGLQQTYSSSSTTRTQQYTPPSYKPYSPPSSASMPSFAPAPPPPAAAPVHAPPPPVAAPTFAPAPAAPPSAPSTENNYPQSSPTQTPASTQATPPPTPYPELEEEIISKLKGPQVPNMPTWHHIGPAIQGSMSDRFEWPPPKSNRNVVPFWNIQQPKKTAQDEANEYDQYMTYRMSVLREPKGPPPIMREEMRKSAAQSYREPIQRTEEETVQLRLPQPNNLQIDAYAYNNALSPIEEKSEVHSPSNELLLLQSEADVLQKRFLNLKKQEPQIELKLFESEASELQSQFRELTDNQSHKMGLKLFEQEASEIQQRFKLLKRKHSERAALKLLEEEAQSLQKRFESVKQQTHSRVKLKLLQAEADEMQSKYQRLSADSAPTIELKLLQEEAEKLQQRFSQMQQHSPRQELALLQTEAENLQKKFLEYHEQNNPKMELKLLQNDADDLQKTYIQYHESAAPMMHLALFQSEAEELQKKFDHLQNHSPNAKMELSLLQQQADELQQLFKQSHEDHFIQLKLLQNEAEQLQEQYEANQKQHQAPIMQLSLLQTEAQNLHEEYEKHNRKRLKEPRIKVQLSEATPSEQRTKKSPTATPRRTKVVVYEAKTKEEARLDHEAEGVVNHALGNAQKELNFDTVVRSLEDLAGNIVANQSAKDTRKRTQSPTVHAAGSHEHTSFTSALDQTIGELKSFEKQADSIFALGQSHKPGRNIEHQQNSSHWSKQQSCNIARQSEVHRSRSDQSGYAQITKSNAEKARNVQIIQNNLPSGRPTQIQQSADPTSMQSIFALGVPSSLPLVSPNQIVSSYVEEYKEQERHHGFNMSSSATSATTKWSSQTTGAGAGTGTGTGTGAQPPLRGATQPIRGRGILKQSHEVPRIPVCEDCRREIRGPFVLAINKTWCPDHFACANGQCRRQLLDIGFVEEKGQKYCEYCFEQYMAPKCAKCSRSVTGDCLNALEKQWHPECFCCSECHQPFGNASFFLEDGKPFCEKDWNAMFTTKCVACQFPIEAGDRWVEALNAAYHSDCFTCTMCHKNLEGQSFYAKSGKPYCKAHA